MLDMVWRICNTIMRNLIYLETKFLIESSVFELPVFEVKVSFQQFGFATVVRTPTPTEEKCQLRCFHASTEFCGLQKTWPKNKTFDAKSPKENTGIPRQSISITPAWLVEGSKVSFFSNSRRRGVSPRKT